MERLKEWINHNEPELNAFLQEGQKPLTEAQFTASFFLCLGGIVAGIICLIWSNIATPGLQVATPLFTDVQRLVFQCSGIALIGVGALNLVMLRHEKTRTVARDSVRAHTIRSSESPTSS